MTRGDLSLLLRLSFNPGDLWALASVPVISAYTVLLNRRPAELEPLVFHGVTVICGVAMLTPFYFWELATGTPMRFTPATVATVAYVRCFPPSSLTCSGSAEWP